MKELFCRLFHKDGKRGPEDPRWEVDLVCGKAVFAENSSYENGKNTHAYRRLLLTGKEG